MTRDEIIAKIEELIPVMESYREGKEVQRRPHEACAYQTIAFPKFDFTDQWRVKREPKEIWVNKLKVGDCYSYPTQEEALLGNSWPSLDYEYIAKRFIAADE